MDKQVFLSRFLSEIVPRIQETAANSEIQHSPIEPVSEGKNMGKSEGERGYCSKSRYT